MGGDGLGLGVYTLGPLLGLGAGTWVRRARRRAWPATAVAVKGPASPVAAAVAAALHREAELLAGLDHPNLVRLLDVVPRDDAPCLVLPLAVGGSLASRVRRHGPLPPVVAVDLLLDVAAAVAALQRTSFVHGDLKPANLLLTSDGRPVVADLGSAAAVGQPVAGGGSGAFAPPELAPGVRAATNQDVFALGAVAAALVTGRVGAGRRGLGDVGVSRQLASAVATATAEGPADRYPTAAAFWSALARCPEAGRHAGGRLGPF